MSFHAGLITIPFGSALPSTHAFASASARIHFQTCSVASDGVSVVTTVQIEFAPLRLTAFI